MILEDILQRILSLYSKGVHSDDTRLSHRHIYNKFLTVRSRLVYEKLNKKQNISEWMYQTLTCVDLIKAPEIECPCLPPMGCTILRTSIPIPKPLTSLRSTQLKSVTSLDGSVTYSHITFEEKKFKSGAKYTAHKPDYFIRNGYLYITHKTGPKYIMITGLFENPEEVEKFENSCGVVDFCSSPLDKEFMIDAEMLEILIRMTAEELIGLFQNMNEDTSNDSQDDNVEK